MSAYSASCETSSNVDTELHPASNLCLRLSLLKVSTCTHRAQATYRAKRRMAKVQIKNTFAQVEI